VSTSNAINAQAELHHQYLLGLQLMVAVETDRQTVYDWMFRLFRRQHEDKFLSSFQKLGLSELPHAVACARYHALSNSIGGVAVEYMEESSNKAWVRFRYPRWMYAGAAICGIPVEASRGFLNGWYAQNGVSLNNPRLGFVCVSEDMTGQFGLCGYFKQYDHVLEDHERLIFAPDEVPPAYDPAAQPLPPANDWSEERLAKANRNYAMEYIRNGIGTLVQVLGVDRALSIAKRAARLTGLQHYPNMAAAIGVSDGGVNDAADFLSAAMRGMGDECTIKHRDCNTILLVQENLRIIRGLPAEEAENLLNCWIELWTGAIASQRERLHVGCERDGARLLWTITC
jgi:hypothetical protein